MSINLLETVQQNLSYPVLQKIDPNTQQVVLDEKAPIEDKLGQAVIPAVLTGLYTYVQTDEGASVFLEINNSINWTEVIFIDNKVKVMDALIGYTKLTREDLIVKMNAIANESAKVVRVNLPDSATIKDVLV